MRPPLHLVCTSLLLLSSPVSANESPISDPSQRSPAGSSLEARWQATQNAAAAAGALLIDLGPLPVDPKDTQLQISTKQHQIGVHRALPEEFTGNLVPLLRWIDGSDNRRIATITFEAQGAISLRIAVQAQLPVGASVRVFDGEGHLRGDALTQADFEAGAAVWLPSAKGDTLSVEISLAAGTALDALSFTVTEVAHRFASLIQKAAPECTGHVDIPCVTNASRREMADATGLIVFEDVGGTFQCTGTLLNAGETTEFEPYFLTAGHCVATDVVAATVEAEWFWQYTICGGSNLDSRYDVTFGGARVLATSRRQDSTLLEFKRALPGELLYSGWDTRDMYSGSSVFTVHHPNGYVAQYAEGHVRRIVNITVSGNIVYDAISTAWTRGVTEGGSSGAGLFSGAAGEHLVGVLVGGPPNCATTGDVFGPFADFFPHIRRWLRPSTYQPEIFTHILPAVPGADGGALQGFIRVLNYSGSRGDVLIWAIDDRGQRRGPVRLVLYPYQTRHFNSVDLENGNPSKGLVGAVGNGTGMWRLELSTSLNISPLAYIRTADGFVTSIHQTAEAYADNNLKYHVPFFNPGRNTAIRSLLRVSNPNTSRVSVTVEGWDDLGLKGDQDVRFSLAAGSSMQISAQQLEWGSPAFTGRFLPGHGKWVLAVTGTRPLHVVNLLSTASGHLTNLSR